MTFFKSLPPKVYLLLYDSGLISFQDDGQPIFEAGKDPGEGQLRSVGNLGKMSTIFNDRSISFREISEALFAKGRSTHISEKKVKKVWNGQEIEERQFKSIGLTKGGRPLIIVMTPRDAGVAKRIITAWEAGSSSKELKKLIKDIPNLALEIRKKT